jgi:hypothetical protein
MSSGSSKVMDMMKVLKLSEPRARPHPYIHNWRRNELKIQTIALTKLNHCRSENCTSRPMKFFSYPNCMYGDRSGSATIDGDMLINP